MFSLFSCIFMPHAEIERQPQTEWKKQLRTYQTSISSVSAKTNSHLGANCVLPRISWSHAPNLHFLAKNGANCVFPWISWSQKPQTCIPWEKPIRTWVHIVFSHGFMGSEAPNLHLFGKTYIRTWVRIVFSHRFRCNNSNPKPAFALGKTNWELGGGLGWWGGGAACSAFLTTSNEPQTDLNMT